MSDSYVAVKDLPEAVQRALDTVSYGRKDIMVEARPRVNLSAGSGAGCRGFAILVNLTTGEHNVTWGSWGGANMFNPTNPVDMDHNEYTLPPNGVAITGVKGGGKPTWAMLHVPASMVDRMLPAPTEEYTTEEKDALLCHKRLKGGEYRRRALEDCKVSASTLDSLVERGLLTRNKAGAMAITTAGKNAVGDYVNYRI